MKKVYLINPGNLVISLTRVARWNKWNKYRVWKPLSLITLARLTPEDWDVEIIDENLGVVDYDKKPRPDLVGVTAFTSQAPRAYQLAVMFRAQGVPVVMGGIHVSMCVDEALDYADTVVTGEAEAQWPRLLKDFDAGKMQRVYNGGFVPIETIPAARHDLLKGQYFCGSVQTTRGCPLRCTFCSVTAFNGGKFRHRPVENVVEELRQIEEKMILFADDNLIGTRRDHIAYSKELFRTMIREKLTRPWICQATINFADDDELLCLARDAGCLGVFIGFESPTVEGLVEVHKKFNIRKGRDMRASVRRIQDHNILVVGSFIMGLDSDKKGISEVVAKACDAYGLDLVNMLILTPLPGTVLYRDMEKAGRIQTNNFPQDWQYYTLVHPVASYTNFTWEELVQEVNRFHDLWYSYPKIFGRLLRITARNWRKPYKILAGLVANITSRLNHRNYRTVYSTRIYESSPAKMPAR